MENECKKEKENNSKFPRVSKNISNKISRSETKNFRY